MLRRRTRTIRAKLAVVGGALSVLVRSRHGDPPKATGPAADAPATKSADRKSDLLSKLKTRAPAEVDAVVEEIVRLGRAADDVVAELALAR